MRLPLWTLSILTGRSYPLSDPPDVEGRYYMTTKVGALWEWPRLVSCESFPKGKEYARVVQMELLHVPKADRRWSRRVGDLS